MLTSRSRFKEFIILFRRAPGPGRIPLVMIAVIPQMTTLAHRFKVLLGAIFWRVIEMRDRQDDDTLRPRSPSALAFLAAPLAWMRPVQSTFPLTFTLARTARFNSRADHGPISWIA